MAKLAKQHGVVIEQEVDGMIIRVRPPHSDLPEVEDHPTTLAGWRQRNVKLGEDNLSNMLYRWSNPDEWLATIPGRPMLKSEKSVIRQLSEYGVGVRVPWKKIKSCGPGTQDRLKVRGYIEVHMQADFPDRLDSYSLTLDGQKAALQLEGDS